ncbi:MAG TPA: hypothetical protein VIK50_13630 [Gemmatimonadaceae bacterium]
MTTTRAPAGEQHDNEPPPVQLATEVLLRDGSTGGLSRIGLSREHR